MASAALSRSIPNVRRESAHAGQGCPRSDLPSPFAVSLDPNATTTVNVKRCSFVDPFADYLGAAVYSAQVSGKLVSR